ncbi:MAG: alpha-amylase family glycosyl hydrolase, partial [Pseudonocardia sp.]
MLTGQDADRLREHLSRVYGDEAAAATMPQLVTLLDDFAERRPDHAGSGVEPFDERDIVLISYGDQVHEPGHPPLDTLHQFLAAHAPQISGLHLLPHYPSTSDDGFAVADFTAVDPALGTWSDVSGLGSDFHLMLDAVVNHTSASHPWFTGWLDGDPRYEGFYIDVDPATDLDSVTRPRTTPLLTPTRSGRWVWTTFSADQVDLDYSNPAVLLAVTEVLLEYVAHGARLLRLDAIAFLWKRVGTSCIHLPETHEIIRFWRTVLDLVAPGTLIVTETNVPHRENLTYLGDGTDEAHLVYQFALPPLTLAAFH